MGTQISNESTLVQAVANADRAMQAAPTAAHKDETSPDTTSSRMRLDMNEILGLKRN